MTPEILRALAGRDVPHADEIAAALAEGVADMPPIERAHLLAQLAHESAGFARLEENLNYSARRIGQVWPRLAGRAEALAYKPVLLANAAYAGRNGNGDEASGDGWRYRGRGLIQITGKSNYRLSGEALKLPLLAEPDIAAEPKTAVLVALEYWRRSGCGAAARDGNIERVTLLINGRAMAGLDDRRRLTARAKELLTEESPPPGGAGPSV